MNQYIIHKKTKPVRYINSTTMTGNAKIKIKKIHPVKGLNPTGLYRKQKKHNKSESIDEHLLDPIEKQLINNSTNIGIKDITTDPNNKELEENETNNHLVKTHFSRSIIEIDSIYKLIKEKNPNISGEMNAKFDRYKKAEDILKTVGIKFLVYRSSKKLSFLGTGSRFGHKVAGITAGIFNVTINGKEHAVKMEPKKKIYSGTQYIENLKRVLAIKSLSEIITCPHVCKVKYLMYVEYMKVWTIVMEKINGDRLTYDKYNKVLGNNLKRKYRTLRDIIHGYSYLYDKNINYSDIKPANLMFSRSGRGIIIDYDNTKEYTKQQIKHDNSSNSKFRKNITHMHKFLNVAYILLTSGQQITSVNNLIDLGINNELAYILYLNNQEHIAKLKSNSDKHTGHINLFIKHKISWALLLQMFNK
jgi:hypothetical protein